MTPAVIAIQTWLSATFAGEYDIEHTLHKADAGTGGPAYTNFLVQKRKNLVPAQVRFVLNEQELSVFVVLFIIRKVIPRPNIEHTRSRIVTLHYADPQLFEQLEAVTEGNVTQCRKDLPE